MRSPLVPRSLAPVSHMNKGKMTRTPLKAVLVRLSCCLGLTAGLAMPAGAQTTPNVEVSGGYQFINLSVGGDSESFPKGWYADVAGNINGVFGVVFEVGGNYKSFTETQTVGPVRATATADIKIHEFMGGMRIASRKNPTVVPYGQVLAGAVNGSSKFSVSSNVLGANVFSSSGAESGTNFAIQFGGGVVIGPSGGIGVRIGADYVRIFASDEDANMFRLGAGINVPF